MNPTEAPKTAIAPLKLFISYARKDKRWRDELEMHLKPLVSRGKITAWDDTHIKPGAEWDAAIKAALDEADIAVLLVTPNFLASDYIIEDELPPFLKGKEKKILWIAVSASNYKLTAIQRYQAVNNPARPLDQMTPANRNAAWVAVCKKILEALAKESGQRAAAAGEVPLAVDAKPPKTAGPTPTFPPVSEAPLVAEAKPVEPVKPAIQPQQDAQPQQVSSPPSPQQAPQPPVVDVRENLPRERPPSMNFQQAAQATGIDSPPPTVPSVPMVSSATLDSPANPAVTRRVALTVLGIGVLAAGGWGLSKLLPESSFGNGYSGLVSGGNSSGNGGTVPPTPAATKTNPKDGAEMVLIPAGDFTMGSADYEREKPPHKVTLDAYYIYKNLVTVGQYKKFCKATVRNMPPAPKFNSKWSKEDHPIVNVSWNDIQVYCQWASAKLPTEAQWEKAARGADGRKFPWGNEFDTSKLWCSRNSYGDAGGTAAVNRTDRISTSPYGVLDMAGNVWEWCNDWYDEKFYSSPLATERNPENQSAGAKTYRVLRGGSWNCVSTDYFRSANRDVNHPAIGNYNYGFRCVVRAD